MNLSLLLDIANSAYPDEYLSQYYDGDGKFVEGSGDSLARFIVSEISETFDEFATDAAQLAEAIRVIEAGVRDMQGVVSMLQAAADGCEHEMTSDEKAKWIESCPALRGYR